MSEEQVLALDPHPLRYKELYGSPQIHSRSNKESNWDAVLQSDTRQVRQIRFSPGPTPRGLHVSDPLARAIALYGTPTRQTPHDATWKGAGLRLTVILDPIDQTVQSLLLSRFTPMSRQKGPIQSPAAAVDGLFRSLEASDGYDQFPRSIGTQAGTIPTGGRLGATLPAQFETAVTSDPDGTYRVLLQTHWSWGSGAAGDTFTYTFRVNRDGTVSDLGQSGTPVPPMR